MNVINNVDLILTTFHLGRLRCALKDTADSLWNQSRSTVVQFNGHKRELSAFSHDKPAASCMNVYDSCRKDLNGGDKNGNTLSTLLKDS